MRIGNNGVVRVCALAFPCPPALPLSLVTLQHHQVVRDHTSFRPAAVVDRSGSQNQALPGYSLLRNAGQDRPLQNARTAYRTGGDQPWRLQVARPLLSQAARAGLSVSAEQVGVSWYRQGVPGTSGRW